MLSRPAGLLLVALIVFPFSPPFSTCDVASMFAAADQTAPLQAHSPADALDSATSHALPVNRPVARSIAALSGDRLPSVLTVADAPLAAHRSRTVEPSSRAPLVLPLRI